MSIKDLLFAGYIRDWGVVPWLAAANLCIALVVAAIVGFLWWVLLPQVMSNSDAIAKLTPMVESINVRSIESAIIEATRFQCDAVETNSQTQKEWAQRQINRLLAEYRGATGDVYHLPECREIQ